MALVDGTNCGFVKVKPTADPDGTVIPQDSRTRAGKFTAPANGVVTEIGWWCDTASEDGNFEVGFYADNGNGAISLPAELLSGESRTNAKGTTSGWKTSAVNIPITAGTIYWVAVQLDNLVTTTNTDSSAGAGRRTARTSQTTLADPFGTPSATNDELIAFYALYTPATRINIGDVWKDVSAIKINIGDVWKDVTSMKINIGDSWKTIF